MDPATLRTIPLYQKQIDFLQTPAQLRGFCAGVGSGKSRVGALDLILRAMQRKGNYGAGVHTYKLLSRATWPTFQEVAQQLGVYSDAAFRKSDWQYTLPNGSNIWFFTTSEPDNIRGPSLLGFWHDEASYSDMEAFTAILGRLRYAGMMGWYTATFTPFGKANWTYQTFVGTDGVPMPDTHLIRARTRENVFNSPDFEVMIRRQYGDNSRLSKQELDGEFLDESATMFSRSWFRTTREIPQMKRVVRAWDLAATEVKPGNDPDFTCGVKIGQSMDGVFYILDVVRDRRSPLETRRFIEECIRFDGREVEQCIEQEPAASAKIFISDMILNLAGHNVRATKPSGTKAERGGPLAAQVEAGHVYMREAVWNKAFLDELEQVPGGKHDDQFDAASHAFNQLVEEQVYVGVV